MANPEPGWYPDPESPNHIRYWDGAKWTDQLRGANPDPPSAQPAAQQDLTSESSADETVETRTIADRAKLSKVNGELEIFGVDFKQGKYHVISGKLSPAMGFKTYLNLNVDLPTSIEIVNATKVQNSGAIVGGSFVGGVLFGPLGFLAGGALGSLSKKGGALIKLIFADGRVLVGEADNKLVSALYAATQ
jgi:hypothetical protein